MIRIEVLENKLDLSVGPAKRVLSNDLLELGEFDGAAVVIIGDAELATKSSDTTGTAVLREEDKVRTGTEGGHYGEAYLQALSQHFHQVIDVV